MRNANGDMGLMSNPKFRLFLPTCVGRILVGVYVEVYFCDGGSECARVAGALGIPVRYTSVVCRAAVGCPFAERNATFFIPAGCFRLAVDSSSPGGGLVESLDGAKCGSLEPCREDLRCGSVRHYPRGVSRCGDYRGPTRRGHKIDGPRASAVARGRRVTWSASRCR